MKPAPHAFLSAREVACTAVCFGSSASPRQRSSAQAWRADAKGVSRNGKNRVLYELALCQRWPDAHCSFHPPGCPKRCLRLSALGWHPGTHPPWYEWQYGCKTPRKLGLFVLIAQIICGCMVHKWILGAHLGPLMN